MAGGGVGPGCSAAIQAGGDRASTLGWEVTGLRTGWGGITFLDRSQGIEGVTFRLEDEATWRGGYVMPLNRLNTATIDRTGGTILTSSRTNPAKVKVGGLPAYLSRYGAGHGKDDAVHLTSEVLSNLEFL